MSFEELDLGEFSLYAGGICLDLAPGKPAPRVALVAEALGAQTGRVADKRAFVERLVGRGEDRFTAVALASVMVHETRHFHDLLLTHVGQWAVAEGLNLAAFLPGILEALRRAPAAVLPLPRWRDLPAPVHAALSRAAGGALAAGPEAALLARLDALAPLQETTDYFFRPPAGAHPAAPPSTLLFEGLATACQLAEANLIDAGDRASVQAFVRRLEARRARSYIDFFDYIETAATRLGAGLHAEHWVAFNLLALRALCPLTRETTEAGEPVALPPALVFMAGIADLHERGGIPAPEAAIGWIDGLAERMGWLSLDATFAALEAMAPQRLAAARPLFLPGTPAEAAAFEGYAAWIAAHRHMLAAVRADPLGYCDPFRYLANTARWVACPLLLPVLEDNLPQVEGFLRGLDGADPAARESLLRRGLRPGFLPIGASHGVDLLPGRGLAALFGGIRLGHAIWRGFRPGQVAAPIARAELAQALGPGTRPFFL